MGGLELLVPIAGEVLKLIIIEQRLRSLSAEAGVSPEALESMLNKVRAEYQALDPTKLPEV